jgi:hypothetical protein
MGVEDFSLIGSATSCGIVPGTASAVCNSITAGTGDTYNLSIPYTGIQPGVTVINNSGSGTVDLSGGDPATQTNGTIVISNISETNSYSVTFSSPCNTLTVSGAAPNCDPPPCGITLGTATAICNTVTAGNSDTYNLSIPYTGVQAGVTVINNSGSGTVGGDNPAVTTNGTIVISNISEVNNYNVTFSTPCSALLVSGNAPACDATTIVINEADADQVGTDANEFVELYGPPGESLTGMVLVFYNGSNDLSYFSLDLDGQSLDANGFFVAGNAGVTNVDVTFANDLLQNGQDAVALYFGNGTDFPNNTAVTTANLIDALVYDTADPDDPGLLVLLNAGQPQVDENGGGNGTGHSNSRVARRRNAAKHEHLCAASPDARDDQRSALRHHTTAGRGAVHHLHARTHRHLFGDHSLPGCATRDRRGQQQRIGHRRWGRPRHRQQWNDRGERHQRSEQLQHHLHGALRVAGDLGQRSNL